MLPNVSGRLDSLECVITHPCLYHLPMTGVFASAVPN
jgi:hypothetical protein